MSVPLTAGTWTLDPVHSVVQFSVQHLGISMLKGRFGDVEATLSIGDELASSSLAAEIAMASIDTGNPDRDGHLSSSDFFSTDTQPKMVFTSDSVEDTGNGAYRVSGTLTLNGHSQAESLDISFSGQEDNPMDGSRRAGFAATGHIDRTDYGIDWNVPLASGGIMLGKNVDILIDAQLVGPATG